MEAGYSRLIVWAVQTNSIIRKAFLELRYHIGVCCELTDSVCSLWRDVKSTQVSMSSKEIPYEHNEPLFRMMS